MGGNWDGVIWHERYVSNAPSLLILTPDKEKYEPGDTVEITMVETQKVVKVEADGKDLIYNFLQQKATKI